MEFGLIICKPWEPFRTYPNLGGPLQVPSTKQKISTKNIFKNDFEIDYANLREDNLVGGWTNPSEKYLVKTGVFPQIGMNMNKNNWKPPPRLHAWETMFGKYKPLFIRVIN